MRTRRKFLAILLAVVMVLSLAACGESGGTVVSTEPSPSTVPSVKSSVDPTNPEPSVDTTASTEPDDSPSEEVVPSEEPSKEPVSPSSEEITPDTPSETQITESIPSEEPSIESSPEPDTSTSSEELVDGMRPEFKEAMDSYEAFYDEYCDFMKKYSENPTDLSLLAEYATLMSKATEMDEKFNEWDDDEMNDIELKYYLEVSSRVMQKLLEVVG